MRPKRNSNRSLVDRVPEPLALQLRPERTFVLHLDARARPPHHLLGRVEHVTSGRTARITSLRGLTNFLADVLRDRTGS